MPVQTVAFSPDGVYLASGSGDGTIRIWDAKTGIQAKRPFKGHAGPVTSVAFSPDGAFLVSGSTDRTVLIWDVETGALEITPLKGHTDAVASVLFSPNSAYIISCSHDCTIQVWDAITGAIVSSPLRGHTGCITSLAISPDGAFLVSGSSDNTIRLWDAKTGLLEMNPLRGHRGSVTSVAFSPDGAYLASGSYDCTVRLWNAKTGVLTMSPLTGHDDTIHCVAFSPNGAYIVSGSFDHTVRVYNAKTGALVLDPLRGHMGAVQSIAFSPNGVYLVSGSSDTTIRYWVLEHGNHGAEKAARGGHRPVDVALYLQHSEQWKFRDGWLIGPQGEQIFWVPQQYRLGLCYGRCEKVIGEPQTVITLRNFVHGENWTRCAPGQHAQTLGDMLNIGQRYVINRSDSPTKERRCPTFRFSDTTEPVQDRWPEANESQDEESDEEDGFVGHVDSGSTVNRDRDVDLSTPKVRDMIAGSAVSGQQKGQSSQASEPAEQGEVDWEW